MPDVFSRWTIISRSEGVEGIAYAIDIIKKLADLASPRFGGGERVIRDEIQTSRDVALQVDRQRRVTGTIVGAKNGNVWKIITPVSLHSGLERIIRAQNPVGIEGVLSAAGGVQCMGSVVIRVDQRRRTRSIPNVEIVDGGEGFDPAVLCEVVEIETHSAAQDRVTGRAESISDAESRSESFAVVVRNSGYDAVSRECGIHTLVVPRSDKKTESGVVAQAIVEGPVQSHAP